MDNAFTYAKCIFYGLNEAELPNNISIFLVYNTLRTTFAGYPRDRLTVRVDRQRPGTCPPSPTGLNLGACYDNEVLALLEVGFDQAGRVTDIVPAPSSPGGLQDEAVQAAVRFLRPKPWGAFGTTILDVSTVRG